MGQDEDVRSQLDTDYKLAGAHIALGADWHRAFDRDSQWHTMAAGTVRHPLPRRSRTFCVFRLV